MADVILNNTDRLSILEKNGKKDSAIDDDIVNEKAGVMLSILEDTLSKFGYKGKEVKIVVTDVVDPNGNTFTSTKEHITVLDRKFLATATRDELLGRIAHEFGHYTKEDDSTKSQKVAKYFSNMVMEKVKGISSQEASSETYARIKNSKNLIIGEKGKELAESIPMDKREYYEAITTIGDISGGPGGLKGEMGIIYNKDSITGKEEFGYILGGEFSIGAIVPEGSFGLKIYEKEGVPIKDFQGFYGTLKGKVALYVRGEYELKIKNSKGKYETNYGFGTPTIGFLGGIGYNQVFVRKNLSEKEKQLIRNVIKNKKSLENVEKTISELRNLKNITEKITNEKIDLRMEAE